MNGSTKESVIDKRTELRGILKSHSLLENGPYRLASGKTSDYYFDCKLTTLCDPYALALASAIIFERIEALEKRVGVRVDAVGGLTSGADPLVIAVSQHAYRLGRVLPAFFVRDEQKTHGTERVIEGQIRDGMNVVILDDVMTTGSSVRKAIKPVEKGGGKVVKIFVLVDREDGGAGALRGYEWEAIFSVHELREKR